jgi:hypothetical protein
MSKEAIAVGHFVEGSQGWNATPSYRGGKTEMQRQWMEELRTPVSIVTQTKVTDALNLFRPNPKHAPVTIYSTRDHKPLAVISDLACQAFSG